MSSIKKLWILALAAAAALALCSCGISGEEGEPEENEEEPPVVEVNILDYVGEGTETNWAVAFSKALREADVVYVPAGTYRTTEISVPSNKTIYGDGESTVFVALGGSSVFRIEGAAGGEIAIARDMEDFSNTLELSKKISLKQGDIVYLQSQRNCVLLEDAGWDWCLGRSYHTGKTCFFGEFLTVESADETTLTFESKTVFPYYYADGSRESDPPKPTSDVADWPYRRQASTVRKVIMAENVVLRDFNIETNAGIGIYARYAKSCLFENINLLTSETEKAARGLSAITMSYSLDCEAKGCGCYIRGGIDANPSQGFSAYAYYDVFKLVSSTRCGFNGCYSNMSTHAFLIGKTDKGGVSLDCYIKDCTASSAVWSGVYTAQGTYGAVITGNTITGSPQGITLSGRKNHVSGNDIDLSMPLDTNYYYVRPAEGGTSGIMLIEGYSIDSVIENNKIANALTAINIHDGYESTNIFEKGKITIRNNTVINCQKEFSIWKSTHNKGKQELEIITD